MGGKRIAMRIMSRGWQQWVFTYVEWGVGEEVVFFVDGEIKNRQNRDRSAPDRQMT